MTGTLLLCSLLATQVSTAAPPYASRTGYDDASQRQQLNRLQQQLDELQRRLNGANGQAPRVLIPRPQPQFFMQKAPLPSEDSSNWIPKQFNGQMFYLVPCKGATTLKSAHAQPQ